MRLKKSFLFLAFILFSPFVKSQNWSLIKDSVRPDLALPNEYDSMYQQNLSSLGWEDGIHLSADGLHLYCTYVPIDILSFSLNGGLPNNFSKYRRGAPEYGMDLISNPIGATEWMQSDILYASRASLQDSFQTWTLSQMARPVFTEGAPSTLPNLEKDSLEFMYFTSIDNPTNNMDIWVIQNTGFNPSGIGQALPAPVNTLEKEDNPNVSKIGQDSLILFFDSDKSGGHGHLDIWYSLSFDNGQSWSLPVNLGAINTPSQEHQAFLFFNSLNQQYELYYSAPHSDGKLAIFRRIQTQAGDWDNWSNAELVVSAGNSAGIGEPTLADHGDLSFVVVYHDTQENDTNNRFDADAWYLRRREPLGIQKKAVALSTFSIFPNPSRDEIRIESVQKIEQIRIYNASGQLHYSGRSRNIAIHDFPEGIYHLNLITQSGQKMNKKFIKH